MNRLFTLSKWLHKYAGLVLILFLAWMSASGVLMNHPDLIAGISVPKWLVPPQYPIENWNRSAMTQLLFSEWDPRLAYACGKQGVWKSTDGGRNFSRMAIGFPEALFYRKTAHLYLWEGPYPVLLAATNNGLYACDLPADQWRRLPFGEPGEEFKKIVRVGDSLVVFSESHAYRSPLPAKGLRFEKIPFSRSEPEPRVTLVRLFFDLHDGKVWGLPGKLLFDVAGIILFFLSISAFYAWYYPWKRRREKARSALKSSRPLRRLFKWFLKYHLKLGMWAAVILLIMGGTGLFMRPPLLAALAYGSIPASLYPGALPDNPWDQKIHNALYDPLDNRLVVQATDGMWSGPADFSGPFVPTALDVPIFVMGATVMEPAGESGYRIGSFNGIFEWQRSGHPPLDLLTGQPAGDVSAVRPAEMMITAYWETPDGRAFVNTHRQGIVPLGGGGEVPFGMPPALREGYRMPLWNYLFEIHNGRFFEDLVGKWYILLVPLGSLLFVLITLSGVFDWLYLNIFRKREPQRH